MASAALSCGLCLLLALSTLAAHVSAQSDAPVSVLMVRSAGDERLANALRAELLSYRYRVLEITPRAADRNQALPAMAQKYEAEAAVRIDASKSAVELWVEHPGGDEPESDELVGGPSLRPELLAVRVTEAMRARGLRVPAPPAEHSQPSAAVNAAVAAAAGAVSTGAVATAGVASTAAVPKVETAAAAAHDQATAEAAPPSKAAAARLPAEATAEPAKPAAERPPAARPPPEAKAEPPAKPAERPAAARLPPSAAAEKPKKKPPPSAAEAPASEHKPEEPKVADTSSARVDTGAPATSSSLSPDRGALVYAEVGTSGVFSPGVPGLGPAFDLWLDLRLQPYRTTSLSLFVLAPLLQTPFENASQTGSGSVRTLIVGGSVDLHMPIHSFELSFGLAAGALFSSVTANPAIGNTMLMMQAVPLQRTAALLARAGVSYQLVDQLRVTARAMAGVGVPELKINFGDEEVATSGLPLIVATIGLELALPWQR